MPQGLSRGESLDLTAGAMSFPKMGNGSSALQLTFSVQGVNGGADLVLFRVGSIVGVSEYADIGSPDPDLLSSRPS